MDFIYICTQKNTILDMSYLPRIADNQLEERLEAFGAVLIEGPKWWQDDYCGTNKQKYN